MSVPQFYLAGDPVIAGLIRSAAGRYQAPAVGTECQAPDPVGVSCESMKGCAGVGVPHLDVPIVAPGSESRSVRAEDHAANCVAACQGADQGTGRCVPDPDGTVIACRGQA